MLFLPAFRTLISVTNVQQLSLTPLEVKTSSRVDVEVSSRSSRTEEASAAAAVVLKAFLFLALICIWFAQQEDDSDCGGGTNLSPSLWPMLGLQLLLLLLWLVPSAHHSWPLHLDTPAHTHTQTDIRTHCPFQHSTGGQETLQLCHPGCMQTTFLRRDIFDPHLHFFFFLSNAKGCSFTSRPSPSETDTPLVVLGCGSSPSWTLLMVQEREPTETL